MGASTITTPKTNVFDLVGSIGTPVLGSVANFLSNRNTNQSNERMQQRQNAWNLEMWNRNNEYNTPAAQMQRLQAAGLNPDLMYGQNASGASGNSSSPVQGTNPIPKQPFQLDPLMFAQIRSLNAQAYKNNMDGDVSAIQAKNDEEFSYQQRLLDLQLSAEQINYLTSMWEKNYKQMEEIDQNIANMKQQWSILHEQINTQVAQTNLLIKQGDTQEAARWLYLAQIDGQELNNEQQRIVNQYLPEKIRSEINENYANAKNALAAAEQHKAEVGLINEQTKTEKENRELIKAKTQETKANTRLANANINLVHRRTQTEIFVAQQKEQEAKFAKANQVLTLVEKGSHSIEMLTGAFKNVTGAMNDVKPKFIFE